MTRPSASHCSAAALGRPVATTPRFLKIRPPAPWFCRRGTQAPSPRGFAMDFGRFVVFVTLLSPVERVPSNIAVTSQAHASVERRGHAWDFQNSTPVATFPLVWYRDLVYIKADFTVRPVVLVQRGPSSAALAPNRRRHSLRR